MKRIVAVSQFKSKKLLGAKQDGNREFISLLACISADGTAIPPGLIYQGESGDLQDVWLEEFGDSEKAYFGVSRKGWTNEELGMSWLSTIFDRNTKEKAGNSKRLLLVDGHSSHVNLQFIDYCDTHGILLAILPPHSTHRLQPLDVGIFSPLANAYSTEINEYVHKTCGFSRVTKRIFWPLFRSAWEAAITKSNIKSAFATTGINPICPEKVLKIFRTRTPSPPPSDGEGQQPTPGSVRAVRRTVKAIIKEETVISNRIGNLIRAAEKLSVENEILRHENKGLRETVIGEKKRRKRGNAMGLIDKDRPGQAQFFSPSKVALARAKAAEIEEQKEADRLRAQEEKARKQAEREEKARQVQERKEIRAREREAKKKAREEELQAKLAARQLREEARTSKKAQARSQTHARRKATPLQPEPPKQVNSSSGRSRRQK
jgi:DDE superfamily endonuclease